MKFNRGRVDERWSVEKIFETLLYSGWIFLPILCQLWKPLHPKQVGTLSPAWNTIEKEDVTEFLIGPFEIIPFVLFCGEGAPGVNNLQRSHPMNSGSWLLPSQDPYLPTWLLGSWLLSSARSPGLVITSSPIIYEPEHHLLVGVLQSPWEDGSSLEPPLLAHWGHLASPIQQNLIFINKDEKCPYHDKVIRLDQRTRHRVPNWSYCKFQFLSQRSRVSPTLEEEALDWAERQIHGASHWKRVRSGKLQRRDVMDIFPLIFSFSFDGNSR